MINKKLFWELGDIAGGQNDFEGRLELIRKETGQIDEKLKKVDPNMLVTDFAELIIWQEDLEEKINRVIYLPELMESTNQKDGLARLMKTKANDLMLTYNQKIRDFSYWIKGLETEKYARLDDENAKRLFKSVPDMEYGLGYARVAAKHNLKKREEEIIENKSIYGEMAISDLRGLIEADFVYDFGKKKIGSQSEILKYVHSTKSAEREIAYKSLFKEHKKEIDKLFVIYQSVVKNWDYDAKLRGYASPIAMRNFANQVPDEAIEVLLETCRENKNIFQRYFQYKAKQMGLKQLRRFDLYAPNGNRTGKQYDFTQAKEVVLEAFGDFSPNFKEKAVKIFDDNHIDSHNQKNKRSGAFCATVSPQITPYILMNYSETLRDVYTLAHELGHGIHSLYANGHYPSSQQANLPLSETASTFGEMILFEKLFTNEKDVKVKKSMLWEKMSDSYATILRQNYFVLFEIEAHKLISRGARVEEVNKLYLSNLHEQFGRSVSVDPTFQYEWSYVSHIFETPFYCYAYNFGELLSLSLWAKYKNEGKVFIPRLEKILTAGGSRDPVAVLSEVGVDIKSRSFWRSGFEVILAWQNQLERL